MARLETEGSGPSLSRMSSFGPQLSAPSMSAGGRVGGFVLAESCPCRVMRFLLVVGRANQECGFTSHGWSNTGSSCSVRCTPSHEPLVAMSKLLKTGCTSDRP